MLGIGEGVPIVSRAYPPVMSSHTSTGASARSKHAGYMRVQWIHSHNHGGTSGQPRFKPTSLIDGVECARWERAIMGQASSSFLRPVEEARIGNIMMNSTYTTSQYKEPHSLPLVPLEYSVCQSSLPFVHIPCLHFACHVLLVWSLSRTSRAGENIIDKHAAVCDEFFIGLTRPDLLSWDPSTKCRPVPHSAWPVASPIARDSLLYIYHSRYLSTAAHIAARWPGLLPSDLPPAKENLVLACEPGAQKIIGNPSGAPSNVTMDGEITFTFQRSA